MSDGQIVSISENKVSAGVPGMVGGEDIILQQFNSTALIVQETRTQITAYMDALSALLTDMSMPAGWTNVLGDVVINTVPTIDQSGIPEPGAITLPGFDAVTFPGLPSLATPPTLTLDYVEPTAPADVNPSLDYMMSTYTSDMWLTLFTKVHNDIANGGTGLAPAVETALFERDAERKRLANEKAYAEGVRAISSRGLSFPQIAMRNLENQMAAEILRQEHASSNEIVIAQGELAQKNTQFAITTGADLEKMLRAFYEVQEKLSLEAKKAVADLVIKVYAEKNQAYLAQWQGIGIALKARVDAVDAIVKQNQVLIDGFKSQTDGAIAQTEQISKERESLVDVAQAEVTVYKTRVDAQTSWYNALTENQKAQLLKAELELRKAEAELKAELDSQTSINGIREHIISALGGISAQVMASALNAVNTSVGHTTSRSAGITEHWGHSESLSEDHNYNETPEA